MVPSISGYLGKRVTAESSSRVEVFKAGWRAEGQITGKKGLFLSADPRTSMKVWMKLCLC